MESKSNTDDIILSRREKELIKRTRLQDIANTIQRNNKNKELNRLYFLAGLIVRQIDDLDMANYMREYEIQISKYHYEVLECHNILFQFLTNRQKHFFGYETNYVNKYGYGMDAAFLEDANRLTRTYFGNKCSIYQESKNQESD